MKPTKKKPTKHSPNPDTMKACREAREAVGKMSAKERDALLARGMRLIYGGKPTKPAKYRAIGWANEHSDYWPEFYPTKNAALARAHIEGYLRTVRVYVKD